MDTKVRIRIKVLTLCHCQKGEIDYLHRAKEKSDHLAGLHLIENLSRLIVIEVTESVVQCIGEVAFIEERHHVNEIVSLVTHSLGGVECP